MSTPKKTDTGQDTGLLIEWREGSTPDGEEQIRGYLRGHLETTLFIINAHPEETGVQLKGAFIPDEEEMEVWDEQNAMAAAEGYLREWLELANSITQQAEDSQ